jgi:hypothetical protein
MTGGPIDRAQLTAFGKHLAATVRDNASPRTTDDMLDAMVDEAIDDFERMQSDSESMFLAEAAKSCRNCPVCRGGDVPCGGCQAGGVCDAFECVCDREELDESEDDDG